MVSPDTTEPAAPLRPAARHRLVASYGLRIVAFTALIAGLALRIVPIAVSPDRPLLTCDGRAYWVMAVALAEGRGLVVEDPFLLVACEGHIELGISHHFAPGLPLIEAAFVSVLGATSLALVLPLILLSVLAVLAVWWATRDLFGPDAALLVGAAMSLDWSGVYFGTLQGYSENLVLITITLTLWAIVRGLRDDRFMLWAGVFAGIGYLSKASIGWFFIIAGLGGFVYRVLFRGWGVLRNRWYLGAIAIFAVPVVIWSGRNISLFWDGSLSGLFDAWQTSGLHSRMVANAVGQPGQLAAGLIGKLPVMVGFFVLPLVPFAPSLWRQLRRWREEEAFGMWLAVGLIFVLGWFFAAVFWVADQTNLSWPDPVRYLAPAWVPLLWLIVRDGRTSTAAWSVCYLLMFAMSVAPPVYFLRP